MSATYNDSLQKNNKTKSGLEKNPTKIDLQQEELAFLKEENQNNKNKAEKKYYRGKTAVDFLTTKKKEMKDNPYRQRFDELYSEIDSNLVNTEEQNPSANRNGAATGKSWTPVMMPFNGGKNYRHIYTLQDASTSTSSLPTSFEPYTFSKVLVATALFGAKIPDAIFEAQDNVWAETMYRLWKQTWKNKDGNGKQALEAFVQNNFLYGWAAMRTYPKRIQQMTKGVPRIKFDDIYRQVLKPNRTWLGVGYSNSDRWSQVEFLFEEDMPLDIFCELFPDAPKDKLEYAGKNTEGDDIGSQAKHVTITHYENEITNTFIKACGDYVIYDGELLNEDGNTDVEVSNCWVRDQHDPYGVGLYELARSNERVANHLRLLNIEQMEAEVRPLLFGATFGNGEMTYKRGSNIINPKPQGTSLDVVNTNGNVAMGMNVVKSEKNSLDAITGINDVVSGLGSESTLGSTVLAKEAAQQRLLLPRNSIIRALEKDAEITVSFIEQVYPEYYIYETDTEEKAQRFIEINESYVTQSTQVNNKFYVLASKKLTIDFDFDIEAINEEDVDVEGIEVQDLDRGVVVSRHALFQKLDEVKSSVNLSRVLDVQVDATSMMIPSEEMKKQNIMSLYPLISESTAMIMQASKQDPETAAVMLKQTMTLMRAFRLDPYEWLPKDMVNQIIAGELMDDDMMALAKMNRQAQLQEQMAQVGMPEGQLSPAMDGAQASSPTGESIAQNPMQASMNASVGRSTSPSPDLSQAQNLDGAEMM